MKTILITGGTQGIGKGIAMSQLNQGNRVIVVSSSQESANTFISEAKKEGLAENAIFIQADLSLVKENNRIIDLIKNDFPVLDTLIFCAAKHNKEYIETAEGLEFTFALAYLSRFILSYGLKEVLEKTNHPVILNICGTGMNGKVNWEDLQHKNSFVPMKVMMHGSRLNDLLAVEFSKNDSANKIKYVLYNPMAVKTPGMDNSSGGFLMKTIFNLIAKPIDKATIPITDLLNNLPTQQLISYTQRKENSLTKPTFDKDNAQKLYGITNKLLTEIKN